MLAVNPCNIEGGGIERSTERPLIDAEIVFDLADAVDPRYQVANDYFYIVNLLPPYAAPWEVFATGFVW